MKLNKKGSIEDGLFWIFRIVLIMIVMFMLVFFVNSVIARHLDSEDLELHLIATRVINSPSCLALEKSIDVYEDDTFNVKRVYPGFVDLKKYKDEYLNISCLIDIDKSDVGIKMKLDKNNPVFINKDYYEDIEPLTFSTKYYKVKKVFPVQVVDANSNMTSNTLEIVVVAKKR